MTRKRRFVLTVEECAVRRHRETDPEPDAEKRLRLLLKGLAGIGLKAVGPPVEVTPGIDGPKAIAKEE